MKTYKQLINEVTGRVRQSAEAWKAGAESIQSNIPPVDRDNKNKHFRAGRGKALQTGRKGALEFTRRERVAATAEMTATEEMAARAAKEKQEAIAANANKRLNDQRERTTP